MPPWIKKDDAEILAKFELAVATTKIKRVQHSVDHVIPLKGICRKTWLATGIKKQVVCGLHVPDNLEVVPLSYNRDIKKDWFDSDWPAWTEEEIYASMFDTDDDVEDRIPF